MPLPTLQEKQNQNRSILAQAMLQRMVVTDSLRKLEANNSILGSMNHHGNQGGSFSSSDSRTDIASLMASRTATSIPLLNAAVLTGPDSLLQQQQQRQQQKLINELRLRQLLTSTVPAVPPVATVPTHQQEDASTSQALHLMSQNGKASINHCMFSKKNFDETKLRMSAMVRATPSVTKAGRPSTLSGIRPTIGSITKVPVPSSGVNSSIAGLQPQAEHKKARIQSSTVGEMQQHRQVELLNILRKQNMLRQCDVMKQLQDRQQSNLELQNQQRLAMLVNELQQQKKQQEETQQLLLLLQQKQRNVQQLAQKKEQRNRSASEDQAKVTKPMSAFDYYFQDEYNAFLKEISSSSENEEASLNGSNNSSRKRKRNEEPEKSINMELLEKLVRDRWDALEQTKSPKLREYRIKEMKDIERYRNQVDEIKRKKIEFFNQSQRRTRN